MKGIIEDQCVQSIVWDRQGYTLKIHEQYMHNVVFGLKSCQIT